MSRLRSRSARWLLLATVLVLAAAEMRAARAEGDDSVYRDLVQRVTGGDFSIDFRLLRLECLKASSCDARGDSKDLLSLRRAMQESKYDKAVKMAEALIGRGFVNIEAQAICSQAHAALKNPDKAKFHQDVTSALIRSILKTGDGKTQDTAFEVIDTREEYIIVSVLGLPRPRSQSLIPGKPHSYDCLEADDPKTGQTVRIYFNIDAFYPMKGL